MRDFSSDFQRKTSVCVHVRVFIERFFFRFSMFCGELELYVDMHVAILHEVLSVSNPLLMYVSYSYMCCTAFQETRISSETCAGETCITDGKHASLVIYVRGNTHPWETHITMTPVKQVL